jgi:CHASE3 domain sensor protein
MRDQFYKILGIIWTGIIMILSSVIGFTLNHAAESVNHTNEVRTEIHLLQINLRTGEAGIRGYTISGKREYLATMEPDQNKILDHVSHLKFLTRDNSEQQERVARLEPHYQARVKEIWSVHSGMMDPKQHRTFLQDRQDAHKESDQILKTLDEMDQDELRLLEKRERGLSWTIWAVVILVALFSLIAIFSVIAAVQYHEAAKYAEEKAANN